MNGLLKRVISKMSRRGYVQMYKNVFGTPEGKKVLSDLVDRFRVAKPLPMRDRKPGDLEYCEGQRQVVLYILERVMYDLNALQELQKNNSIEVTND